MKAIDKTKLQRWQMVSKVRGVKTKCHKRTGLSRPTIDAALKTGEASVGTIYLLSKFFK